MADKKNVSIIVINTNYFKKTFLSQKRHDAIVSK